MAYLFKNVELEFAKAASLDPVMDTSASVVESAVKSAAPVAKGDFKRSIGSTTAVTKRGVHDRVVYSNDEEAEIIEWGGVDKKGNFHRGHFTFSSVADRFK